MTDNLKIIAEFVDNASTGIKAVVSNMAQFTKGMLEGAKAELKAVEANKAHAASAAQANTSLGGLVDQVKQLAIAFVAAKLVVDGFIQSIRNADKLDELAGKYGTTAANLRDLSFAAKQSDTSLESLLSGFNKLGRSIDKSDEEATQQAQTFKQLGIETQDLSGEMLSSEQIFAKVADKFKDMKDGPEKSAAAFRLFGGEAKNLIPLLNKGSEGIAELKKESQDLGGVGPDAFNAFAAASGQLFDNIEKVKTVSEGFFTTMASQLVPVLNIVIEQFVDSAREGGLLRDIMNGITSVFNNVLIPAVKVAMVVFNAFTSTIKIAGKGIGALFAIIGAVASGDFAGAKAIIKEYGEDVAKVANEHVAYTQKVALAGHEAVKLADRTKKAQTSIGSLKKVTKETKDELAAYVQKLREANVAFGQDDSVKARIELQNKYNESLKNGGNITNAAKLLADGEAQIKLNQALRDGKEAQDAFNKAQGDVATKQEATQLLEFEVTLLGKSAEEREIAIQKFKDEVEIRKLTNGLTAIGTATLTEELKALQARNAEANKAKAEDDRLKSLTSGTMVQTNAKVLDDVGFLYKAYTDGKIKSEEEYIQAVTLVLDRLKDKNKTVADETTVFWQEAAKGIQNSLQTFFFDAMQGNITNLGDSFKKVLDQMIANALAARLSEALFGAGFEKGGAMGGWAGAASSFLGSFFGGNRANGGPVQAGMAYRVNERTANSEFFVPKVSGTIVPSFESGGGGSSNHFSTTIHAVDSQSFLSQAAKVDRELSKMHLNAQRKYNLRSA